MRPGRKIVVLPHVSGYQKGVRILSCFLLIAALAGAGCQSSFKQTMTEGPPESAPLKPTTRVYVAMPEDGVFKKEPVEMSGKRTAIAMEDAFKKQTKGVIVARTPEPIQESLARARAVACEYVAAATIIKWQDRATEWSAIPDKIEIKIDLISVDTGEPVRTTTFSGRGRVMTDGGDAPQDMLADPIDKFVRTLFRRTFTPSALPR